MNAARKRATARVSRLVKAEAPIVRHAAPAPVATVRRRDPAIPAALAEQLAAGKLSQRCDVCGITEAAGFTCTSCDRATGPADWFRPEASTAQKAALTASRAMRHPTSEDGSALAKSPTFGVLAGPAESLTLGF
jgi:hypothetical protein